MDTTVGARLKAKAGSARLAGRKTRKEFNAFLVRDLFVLVSIGIGLVIVLRREALLPARFLGDERTIQTLAQQTWETQADPSYGTVALLYRVAGLADAPLLASILGFTVGCIPYFIVFRSAPKASARGLATPIVVFGILLTAIYMGTFSKEIFIVPIIAMVLTFRSGPWKFLTLLMAILAYAYFFRSYWFVLAAAFTVLMMARRFMAPSKIVFAIAPTLVVLGSTLIIFLMSVPGDYYRSSVNAYRESYGDVNSLIPRYVEIGEPLSGIANNVLSYVFLQFPFPLLAKFSPYYIVLAGVISLVWIVFYRALLRSPWHSDGGNHAAARYSRVALFLISFLVTQSFFEPDYGSALKHLTPFVPALLWIYVHSCMGHPMNLSNRKELL